MDFKKFLKYWPWFVISLLLFMGSAYYYIGEVSPSYETSALINFDIVKEKEAEIINTEISKQVKKEGIEQEKMFITSNDFLYKIVTDLKLNINYFEKGKLQNKVLYDVPFVVKPNMPSDSLPQMKYDIKIVKLKTV